jgi:GNAT superfamily N-acetyltransferase
MNIRKIDTENRRDARRFVEFPNELYRDCPRWVPLPLNDGLAQLNRRGAYFLHSDADFFVAEDGDRMLGRLVVMENRHYNEYHQSKHAFFYLFDVVEDFEVAQKLFEAAIEWARARGLTKLVGPKGFLPLDGIGMLYQGFEHWPAMGVPYNYEYYNRFMEQMGFEKEIDFTSFYANVRDFELPERIARVAERVKKRQNLRVKTFKSKNEVRQWVWPLVQAYNKIFVENWEYVPVTQEETAELTDRMLQIVQPEHIKFIINESDEVIGFILTFLNIAEALHKTGGKLFPFGWITLLRALRNPKYIDVNGMGILQEYRGLGGNAILYDELIKTVHAYPSIEHADMTQMADWVVFMKADVVALGGKPYKVHRVYRRDI